MGNGWFRLWYHTLPTKNPEPCTPLPSFLASWVISTPSARPCRKHIMPDEDGSDSSDGDLFEDDDGKAAAELFGLLDVLDREEAGAQPLPSFASAY